MGVTIILLIGIFIVLIVIAARTRRRPTGLFVRRCPHCRELIPDRASVCSHCGRDVPKTRWIWERSLTAAQKRPSLAGSERLYRGYTYVVAENGEAELKLSSGAWRKFPSEQYLQGYVDAVAGHGSSKAPLQ